MAALAVAGGCQLVGQGSGNPSAAPTVGLEEARKQAAAVVAGMTLEQKAAQLIMAPLRPGDDPAVLASRQVGAVVLLGDGWDSAAKVKAATAPLREAAEEWPARLWIAADQEGGQIQRLRGTGFETIPDGIGQGKMKPRELREAAQTWGGELLDVGVNLDLAPVVDLVDPADRQANAPVGSLRRDYGLDAAGTAEHAKAFIEGMRAAGVGTAVKHFPGLGRVTGNTDLTTQGVEDAVTDREAESVQAFADVFEAGPTMVMVSVATYSKMDPTGPGALSPTVIMGLLREQLGWRGVVVSDSLSAAAAAVNVSGPLSVEDRILTFLGAGGDIACFGVADEAWAALDGLIAKAQSDPTVVEMIDQAAMRVIAAKAQAGLV
jgi:beta-N-acetylhexosaminidase